MDRAEREAKEKLIAKRKLKTLNANKDGQAVPPKNASKDEMLERDDPSEDHATEVVSTGPAVSDPPFSHHIHGNELQSENELQGKERRSHADQVARKRGKHLQDDGDETSRKKKKRDKSRKNRKKSS